MSSRQRETRKTDQNTRRAKHPCNQADLCTKLNNSRNRPRSPPRPRRSNLLNSTKRGRNQSEERHSRERKNATHQKSGRSLQTRTPVDHQSSKRPTRNKNDETYSREQLTSSERQLDHQPRTSGTSLSRNKIPTRKGWNAYNVNERSNIRRTETGQEAKSKRPSKKSPPRSKHSSSKANKRSNPKQNETSRKRRRSASKEKHVMNNSATDSRKRGRTSASTHQPKKKPRIELNPFIRYDDRLTRLLSTDPSEIIIALLNDHKYFFDFLKWDKLSAKSVEEILEILSNLYETPYTQNFAKIFAGFQDTVFLKHVRRYIFQLSISKGRDHSKIKTHLERIIRFFHEFLNRFPDICEDLPLDVLLTYSAQWQTDINNNNNSNNHSNNNNRNNNNEELNGNNVTDSEDTGDNITPPNTENSSTVEDPANKIQDSVRKLISLRDEILRRKLSPNDVSAVKKPPDDYKSIPIFPRREDIISDKPPFLRKNIVRGRYSDVAHYLDVQFRLLREDYIAPIRDGVLEATGIQEDRSRSIHVYRNVLVVGRLLDTKSGGLLYRVKFDASRMPRVNWEHSKRFKYGSLYCLIDSETRSTMYFMTISERNHKDLQEGFVNVKLFDDDRAEPIPGEQQFLMIESPAYFESYRHVLEGLQNFSKDNLPFQRYLVECESEVRPPVYLVKSTNVKDGDLSLNEAGNFEMTNRARVKDGGNKRSNGCYDLTNALACKNATSVSVLDPLAWPSLSHVNLNSSQFNALKAALTREFVVIQGPPGTGKTFVGLRIANALLTNKSIWRRTKPLTQDEVENGAGKHSPMLVVCYTNHALDQFLEGILEITENVVRVGGRGKSESLERFNLKQRKKMTKESPYWRNLKGNSKKVLAQIEEGRSVIEAANKELGPSKIEKFLNEEESEQLEKWERVAHQMQVHRIDAWLRMHDQCIAKPEKRKRSSTTSSENDQTKCDNFTAKRLRNTVHRERKPTHGDSTVTLNSEIGEQVHDRKSSTTLVHLPPLNHASLGIPIENAQKSIGGFDELEEGELPDSGDDVFYKGNDTHTMTDATRMIDDDMSLRTANHLEQNQRQKPHKFGYNVSIQAQELLLNRIQDSTTVKTITNSAESEHFLNTALSNEVIKQERVHEPSCSLVLPGFSEENLTTSKKVFNGESMGKCLDNIFGPEEEHDVGLAITVVSKIACQENKNIASDGIDQKDTMDHEDDDMLGNKHSIYEINEKLGSRMSWSARNENIADNEDNVMVIDKHSNDERDKENANDSTMFLFSRNSGKANYKEDIVQDNKDDKILGGKNSNKSDKEDDSSKMSLSGAGNSGKTNDTFAEDVEEGEILDTEDDVTDGDEDDDDEERGHAIDLTTATIFKQKIILEDSKSAGKCTNGNDEGKINTELGLENVKDTNGSVEQRLSVGQQNTLSEEDSQTQDNEQKEGFELKALSKEQRTELHKEWIGRYFKHHGKMIDDLRQRHDGIMKQLYEIESIQVERVLKDVDVIGMTTTGAAKHRLTLQQIKPRIVIVEEAAEVLEGHVITALSSGTDHLILIGDHKQLKPNPAVYELARKYNLDVSLFERMIANGLTCHSLDTQHRMRPEIADIMRIIYPKLVDDVSVQCYRSVTGIQQNVYFIDHEHLESGNEELKSPSNEHEVAFVAALCKYLLLQGYQGNKITVLTMYTGQLLRLQRCMPQESGIRISSVDNFQGEESDIIILSLVRSNKSNKIGFLNVSNRVCVALSRAKKAMYCIGNISMMAEKNKLWRKIKNHLQQKSLIGKSLPLRCPNHPEKKIEASSAEHFKKAPEGGCLSPCEFRLPCGHVCSLYCHSVDQKHEVYRCTEKCLEELCDLKHPCKQLCHFNEDCRPCDETISFVIPTCNHEVLIECCQREKIICPKPCTNNLPCGHSCAGKCGQDCDSMKCLVKVPHTLQCDHETLIPCSVDVKSYKCCEPCEKMLECGHKCPGDCYECYEGTFHVQCKEPCKRLLVCSHECKEPCTKNCPPCRMSCTNRCYHSRCHRNCGELCVPCRMPCMWSCEHHECPKRCGEICEREKCNEPCLLQLECGHQCVGVCGDYCPRLCRTCDKDKLQTIFLGGEEEPNALYIELVDCKHVFEVNDLDYWMEGMEDDENVAIQLKVCPKCKTPVRRSLRYGNIVKKTLADIETVKKKKLEEQEQLHIKRGELRGRVNELSKKYRKLVSRSRLLLRVHELRSDADEHNTLENQLHFLSCLGEIDEMFFDGSEVADFVAPSSKLSGEKDRIRELLHNRKLLTNQEIKDISDNIDFLSLRCRFQRMLRKIEENNNCSLSEDIKSSIDSAKEIMSSQDNAIGSILAVTDVERAVVASLIEDVNKKIGVAPLTPEERADIVKAVNLSKGHWFKCSNGHIYAIADCGGAMVKANCPECHEVIGGSNHQLVEGNQLAPEMDGARHPAWSDQANLLNYDPEELRRLRR